MDYKKYIDLGFTRVEGSSNVEFNKTGYGGFSLEKELGFDESCFGYCCSSFEKNIIRNPIKGCVNSALDINEVALPLTQQALRWFRDKYKLIGYIQTSYITSEKRGEKNIPCAPRIEFTFGATSTIGKCIIDTFKQSNYKTYEEAESDLLSELIEIALNRVK